SVSRPFRDSTWARPRAVLRGLWRPLRRIVEECFLGDAVTVPALIRKLFHVRLRAVQPLEIKNPSDDDVVTAHENGTDTRRLHGSRLREDRALTRHQQVSPDARRRLVLLH